MKENRREGEKWPKKKYRNGDGEEGNRRCGGNEESQAGPPLFKDFIYNSNQSADAPWQGAPLRPAPPV